ncbi:glycosyltransferase, partial [bacterium]|nr:glycosyltransferase [bacterium]
HKNKITITGFVSLSDYKNYLCAADIAVQLRTTSRGETSISVLDCLSHGIPTILNSHGSFAEIPETVVYQLKDDFTNAELIIALEELYNNKSYRDGLAKSGREYVEEHHSPKNSAEQYAQNIECLYNEHPYFKHKTLIRNVTEIPEKLPGDNDLVEASISISENFPTTTTNQLFVDISELIKKDAKSGIQRVVHGILSELLTRDLIYHVKPVYKKNGRYFYAHDFTLNYLKLNYKLSEDRVIDIQKDDIFLALDLHIEKDIGTENFLEHHKRRGLKVYSVVYDLIPIIQKQFFPHGAFDVFGEWLNKSSRISDGLICISRAVADELLTWLNKNNPNRFTPLEINYFKLGSDFLKKQIPIEKHEVSDTISLLMVGTLEPRKNYSFVIDSLEHLWKENVKVNLTIIGKSGWMNDEIKEKIECHEEYNKRLFWKQNTTDLELEKYYNTSSALIMASECEGFGLPIVEASTYNLPVIARDIPVFHEIADNNVFYFSDRNPKDFSNSMKKWISLFNSDKHPKSINIKRISWKESCNELLSTIIEDNCYKRWEPAEKIYQETQSNTVFSVVGEKEDNMIITTGVEGFLTYGPYKNLKSGKYSIKIFGQILFFENGKSILEITCNKGREVIAKFSLDETLHSGIIIDETFNVYRNSEDVEIRVWVNSFVIAKISKYIVE